MTPPANQYANRKTLGAAPENGGSPALEEEIVVVLAGADHPVVTTIDTILEEIDVVLAAGGAASGFDVIHTAISITTTIVVIHMAISIAPRSSAGSFPRGRTKRARV